MKFIILIALIAAVTSTAIVPFSEKDLETLAHLEYEDLPKKLQDIITLEALKVGDNSHWCCTNEQPVNTIQRTKIIKEVHTVATNILVGYTSCGFMGTDRCPIYSKGYKQVVEYHIQTYEVPDETACPDHHVKCCTNYLEIAGNCLEIAVVAGNYDLLVNLLSSGLILPPTYAPGK